MPDPRIRTGEGGRLIRQTAWLKEALVECRRCRCRCHLLRHSVALRRAAFTRPRPPTCEFVVSAMARAWCTRSGRLQGADDGCARQGGAESSVHRRNDSAPRCPLPVPGHRDEDDRGAPRTRSAQRLRCAPWWAARSRKRRSAGRMCARWARRSIASLSAGPRRSELKKMLAQVRVSSTR